MEHPDTSALPKGFLTGTGPEVTVKRIDFADPTRKLQEYENLYAVILENALSKEECNVLISAVESRFNGNWERAKVNTGDGGQAMYTDVRDCGRIIWDSQKLADRVWKRVELHIPEILELTNWPDVTGMGPMQRREIWRVSRLNDRMRFLKYEKGEYFRPHCDGMYETPDKMERLYFTLHLYLNGVDSKEAKEPLQGGATTFHGWNMVGRYDVDPKTGSVLIFQQRNLKHSGEDVRRGVKYSLRSDVMFSKLPDVKAEYVEITVGIKERVKKY